MLKPANLDAEAYLSDANGVINSAKINSSFMIIDDQKRRYATVELLKNEFKFLIDTGTALNLIDEKTSEKLN